MPEILLDRVGDAHVPLGYRVVTSEVEFLQYATGGEPLLVRGSFPDRLGRDLLPSARAHLT